MNGARSLTCQASPPYSTCKQTTLYHYHYHHKSNSTHTVRQRFKQYLPPPPFVLLPSPGPGRPPTLGPSRVLPCMAALPCTFQGLAHLLLDSPTLYQLSCLYVFGHCHVFLTPFFSTHHMSKDKIEPRLLSRSRGFTMIEKLTSSPAATPPLPSPKPRPLDVLLFLVKWQRKDTGLVRQPCS